MSHVSQRTRRNQRKSKRANIYIEKTSNEARARAYRFEVSDELVPPVDSDSEMEGVSSVSVASSQSSLRNGTYRLSSHETTAYRSYALRSREASTSHQTVQGPPRARRLLPNGSVHSSSRESTPYVDCENDEESYPVNGTILGAGQDSTYQTEATNEPSTPSTGLWKILKTICSGIGGLVYSFLMLGFIWEKWLLYKKPKKAKKRVQIQEHHETIGGDGDLAYQARARNNYRSSSKTTTSYYSDSEGEDERISSHSQVPPATTSIRTSRTSAVFTTLSTLESFLWKLLKVSLILTLVIAIYTFCIFLLHQQQQQMPIVGQYEDHSGTLDFDINTRFMLIENELRENKLEDVNFRRKQAQSFDGVSLRIGQLESSAKDQKTREKDINEQLHKLEIVFQHEKDETETWRRKEFNMDRISEQVLPLLNSKIRQAIETSINVRDGNDEVIKERLQKVEEVLEQQKDDIENWKRMGLNVEEIWNQILPLLNSKIDAAIQMSSNSRDDEEKDTTNQQIEQLKVILQQQKEEIETWKRKDLNFDEILERMLPILNTKITQVVKLSCNSRDCGDAAVGVGITTEDIERMIKRAIAKYDADKTGVPDLALESAGGSILSTRCTISAESKLMSRISFWGFRVWSPPNTPRTIIQVRLLFSC